MPTVKDVPADFLINRLVENLKKISHVSPPSWSKFVKTGSHKERFPQEKEWWYIRCASLLRKIYLNGHIGLSELRKMYGGTTRTKHSMKHHRDASGSIIRKSLQQLQDAGLVTTDGVKGRVLTGKGSSLLDKLSNEILGDASV